MNIQDPFRHSFNVSWGASYKSCKEFIFSILLGCQAYQNGALWTTKTENWGLISLFSQQPGRILQEQKQDRSHTIHLPVTSEGGKKLRNILEYGLLFHCTEFLAKDEDSDKKLLLKLQCKAFHKTWQGRDFIEIPNINNTCPLKQEHLISKELVDKSESKRQVFCEFHCLCFEVKDEAESKLVVRLDFMESRYPPIVAIFLKEFIPQILRKL